MSESTKSPYLSKEKRSRAPSILFKDNFLDMDDISDFEDEEMDSEMKDIFQNLTPLSSSTPSSHRSSLILTSITSPVLSIKQHEDEEEDEEAVVEDDGNSMDLSPDSKKMKGKVGNFVCKACGEAFNESWTLANHAKSNHPDYPKREESTFKRKSPTVKKMSQSPILSSNSSSPLNNSLEFKNIKPPQKKKRGRPPKSNRKLSRSYKLDDDDEDDEEEDDFEDDDDLQDEESFTDLGEIIHQILSRINDFADGIAQPENDSYKNFEVFKEFSGQKKRKLSDFLAKNIDNLMQLPTKVDVSIQDFRNSTLGEKVRQKLDNLKTLKKAMEQGLIFEEQFEEKQKQFLDSFSFSLPC